MKNLLLVFFIVIVVFVSKAQQADTIFMQLYGIGGGYSEAPNGNSISFSIGEAMVNTVENFNQTLTQGFQQNSFEAVVSKIEVKDVSIQVEAYPNPTKDFLNIKTYGTDNTVLSSNYKIMFYDLLGKEIVLQQYYVNEQTVRFNLFELPPGTYLTKVVELKTNKMVAVFKVIKTGF